MHICIAGPMTLELINHPFDKNKLPIGYPFPPMAEFVNAFLKRGHKITAVTYSTGIDKPIYLESESINIFIAKRRDRHAARDFFNYETLQLRQFLNSIKVDLVASQWSYEFSLAALRSEQQKVTVRLRDYPPLIFRYNHDPYRFMRLLIHIYVTNRAEHLEANSSYLYNQLSTKLKQKTVILPNFISLDKFNLPKYKKENYIITVSEGFKGRKNIARGIIAYSLVRKSHPELEYYLIGSDLGEYEAAQCYAIKNKIDAGIKFIGKQSYKKTLEYISKAKLMVHPSLEESFGYSVLEAMILGTPVLGGDKSGNLPYLLGFGEYGEICNIKNPIEISSKINEMLSDDNKLSKIANLAKIHAIENYSEEVVVQEFEKYYEKVVNE